SPTVSPSTRPLSNREVATLCRLQRPGSATEILAARRIERKWVGPSNSNTDTPPNALSTSPVCTPRMRLPSLTQALLALAKLTSCSLLVVFSRFANCAIGGAAYSPTPYMIRASVTPARPTGHAIRHTDTPEALVT